MLTVDPPFGGVIGSLYTSEVLFEAFLKVSTNNMVGSHNTFPNLNEISRA